MRHRESQLQIRCVSWFRYQYPQYVIMSTPNGGVRSKTEAAIMKAEGMLAGASDLTIFADGRVLFVEMKTDKGRQSSAQKDFQRKVEGLGFRYVICRSLEDFMEHVRTFIQALQPVNE